jgi:hypothetical protein
LIGIGVFPFNDAAACPVTCSFFTACAFTRNSRHAAGLRYAGLFKQGEHAIDKDEVYAELARHFSSEEIIELGPFCAEVGGVGKFIKSLNVLS